MNFEWMKEHTELAALYGSALEAEKYVLVHPAISAMASRKAMEIVVKTLYQEAVNGEDMPVFVDDMTTTWDFRIIVSDNVVINAIHTVRENCDDTTQNGLLTESEAMQSLEALHKLTAWFGVRKGILQEEPPFIPPKTDRLKKIIEKINPANLTLRIKPYIHLNGDVSWLPELEREHVLHLTDLSETPKNLCTEAFFAFLEQFTRSKRQYVDGILKLMPLSPATEREWGERRQKTSPELIGEVDAFVDAMYAEEKNDKRVMWRRYADLLGDLTGWYLQLAHPDFIPMTMRSGFILPEVICDTEQYVSLDSAVEQMLREMASGNEKKGQLMTNKSWCREYLGMDRPVLLPLSNNATKEERQKYSKNALHIGNKKFFYLTEWDKASLFSLRARSGKVGEELVTLDRMADWGFADPDSPAALRARERARIREAEEAAKEAKRQSELQADQLARASKSMLDEVSPKEIRNAIQKMPDYQQNVSLLTIPDWCKKHIGMDEPVLLAEGEWMRLRKRQQSAGKLLTYSACMVSIGRVSYVIHRMDHDTYDAMLKAFQSLGI